MATPGYAGSPLPGPAATNQPRQQFHAASPAPQPQQQQQQQSQTQPSGQTGSPTKEVNTATLCRFGQDTVQEIVQKTTELFGYLRIMPLPTGDPATLQSYQEKKAKIEEQIKHIALLFKQLRTIYNAVRQNTATLESRPVEELLPIEEDGEVKGDRPKVTEAARYASEEHKELIEQIRVKNQQLKDIIDHLRTIIWEINTMMSMTKPIKLNKSPQAGTQP